MQFRECCCHRRQQLLIRLAAEGFAAFQVVLRHHCDPAGEGAPVAQKVARQFADRFGVRGESLFTLFDRVEAVSWRVTREFHWSARRAEKPTPDLKHTEMVGRDRQPDERKTLMNKRQPGTTGITQVFLGCAEAPQSGRGHASTGGAFCA